MLASSALEDSGLGNSDVRKLECCGKVSLADPELSDSRREGFGVEGIVNLDMNLVGSLGIDLVEIGT